MGPFDDDSYWAGERDALMGEHPEHDNVGYMAGWFSGMEEAEREIGGEEDDFDDEDDFEEDDEDDLLEEEDEDLDEDSDELFLDEGNDEADW